MEETTGPWLSTIALADYNSIDGNDVSADMVDPANRDRTPILIGVFSVPCQDGRLGKLSMNNYKAQR